VSVALWALFGALAAVLVVLVLTTGLRVLGARRRRRFLRYHLDIDEQLTAYVAGARDDPPPPPRGRFEQRVMRRELVRLAPLLKGEPRSLVAGLFVRYGLIESTVADLRGPSGLDRIRAAEELGAMGAIETGPALAEGLADDDLLFRIACARALADLGEVVALPSIAASLSEAGADPGDLAEIVLGFGPGAEPFLREQLGSAPAVETRRLAAATLGEIRALEAVPDLLAVLGDPDDELVASAARALGRIGDTTATAALIDLLQGRRPWFVHVAAASALGGIDDPDAAPALTQALGAEDWELRNAAARSLVGFGEAGLRAVVERLDELPDVGVAHYAGLLDVAWRLEPVIERGLAGDAGLERFSRRAAGAGVTARWDELADRAPA
jgi:HEAT repeat protein